MQRAVSEHRSTILVVDDNADLRQVFAETLRDSGYAARAVANGAEALIELSQLPPPCMVLLDLAMPIMSGSETLTMMRSSSRLATVPVCVISSDVRELPPGAQRALRKPVTVQQLLEVVRSCHESANEPPRVPGRLAHVTNERARCSLFAVAQGRRTLAQSRALVRSSRERLALTAENAKNEIARSDLSRSLRSPR